MLEWSYATDRNLKGFEVERSTDGGNFEKVFYGSHDDTLTIWSSIRTLTDVDKVGHKIYYYRLKIIYFDDVVEYSPVK